MEDRMGEPLYHAGSRQLQDRFDSRRIADRLEQVTLHDRFTDGDRAMVARCAMFFLATADAEGQPDVSYKGGMPGFGSELLRDGLDRVLVAPVHGDARPLLCQRLGDRPPQSLSAAADERHPPSQAQVHTSGNLGADLAAG